MIRNIAWKITLMLSSKIQEDQTQILQSEISGVY